jgi:hypothetical protein
LLIETVQEEKSKTMVSNTSALFFIAILAILLCTFF